MSDSLTTEILSLKAISRNLEEMARRIEESATGEHWVVLYHSERSDNDWYYFKGSYDAAVRDAMVDRRHLNYDRSGVSIIPCAGEPEAVK